MMLQKSLLFVETQTAYTTLDHGAANVATLSNTCDAPTEGRHIKESDNNLELPSISAWSLVNIMRKYGRSSFVGRSGSLELTYIEHIMIRNLGGGGAFPCLDINAMSSASGAAWAK
jgi:hypothetical protein